MVESSFSSVEPAYLSKLGLSALPFSEQCVQQGFYTGAHRGQTKNLILHLLRSTQEPILLTASKGFGKTALLNAVLQEAPKDLRFCLIDSQTQATHLFEKLATALAINSDAVINTTATLETVLSRLQKLSIKLVLLIDDVNLVNVELLEQLHSLIKSEVTDGVKLVQAVFSAEQAPDGLLQRYTGIQSVTLLALEKADIAPYLLQRLKSVGFEGSLPFDDKDIQTFYRKSAGNPSQLCHLAHQHLLFAKPKQNLITIPAIKLPVKPLQIVFGIIGIAIIVVVMVFQDKINAIVDVKQVEDESNDKPLVVEDEITTVDITTETKPVESDTSREELEQLLEELESDVPTDGVEPIVKSEPEAVEEIGQPMTSITVEAETQASTSTDEVVFSPLKDSQWVLAQKSTAYTYQLKGAWSESELDEFVDSYSLTGDMAKFASLRNGKPWHVLIYGVYHSKKEALAESKKWPAPLNSLPTWLRRFDSVQKQIKEKGVSP